MGGGSNVAGAISNVGSSEPLAGEGQIDIGRRLVRSMRGTVGKPRTDSRATSAPVDETFACSNGGTVRIFGDVNPTTFTGTVTVVFSSCREGGDALNGSATMTITSALELLNGDLVFTNFTMTFGRMQMRGSVNVDVGGSVHVVTDIPANQETITENIVALNVSTGRMTKSEGLVFIDRYDNVLNPTRYTESMSGRVFDSVHGSVTITTVTPLVFVTLAQPFPDSGQLRIVGAGNRRINLTANSATVAILALDIDGDGLDDITARLNWADLTEPAGANLADTDGDGMHDSWETAFGLNPNLNDATGDLDNDGFTNIAEYNAGTRPNVADATLPPPPNPGTLPPGPAVGHAVQLASISDIAYSSMTQLVYAAMLGNPGSVIPINPTTGAVGTAIPVGRNPIKLAVSDNGQYLYVGFEATNLNGLPQVWRINLASHTVDLAIPLGNSQFNGPQFAEDIQVLPGNPTSFVVSLRNCCFSPRHEGVAVFDGATRRAQVTPNHTGSNVIEFSASAGTLYGYNNETTEFGFRTMAVTASGVTVTDNYTSFQTPTLLSGFATDIHFGGGFIYSTDGKMVDPIARTVVRSFSGAFGPVVSEPLRNRVFYLTASTVRAFDVGSGTEVGNASLTNVAGVNGTPNGIIRWGAKGLAVRTSLGQIFMVESTSWIP